jgi:hypothetical protein
VDRKVITLLQKQSVKTREAAMGSPRGRKWAFPAGGFFGNGLFRGRTEFSPMPVSPSRYFVENPVENPVTDET